MVSVTRNNDEGDASRIYFDGKQGEQEFYVNMLMADFERGRGSVPLNLHWAQNGQEFDTGVSCAFVP